MQASPSKVLVLGLDGLDFDVIEPLLQAGEMPNLARLRDQGAWGKLRSTIPPISSAAWTSLCTGVNPGKHGILGFARTLSGTYSVSIIRTTDVAVPQLWDLAAGAGKQSIVFALPQLHPPVPVAGVMVTGIMTPHARSAWCYPRELEQELTAAGLGFRRRLTVSGARKIGNALTLRAINAHAARQAVTARYLMARQPWDLAVIIFDTPDLMQHILMGPACGQERRSAGRVGLLQTRAGRVIAAHFRELDRLVGGILEDLPAGTAVVAVSDHGFGPKHKIVHLNQWLVERGYLRYRAMGATGASSTHWRKRSVGELLTGLRLGFIVPLVPKGLRDREFHVPRVGRMVNARVPQWSETRAVGDSTVFCMGLRINLRGREPEGIVEPGEEYERLRDALMADLRELRDPEDGTPVVAGVWRREELHPGDHNEAEPDVIVDFHPDYRAIPRSSRSVVRTSWSWQAAGHMNDGILVAAGPGVTASGDMGTRSILDIAPSVLALLGVRAPAEMEGEVLPCVAGGGHGELQSVDAAQVVGAGEAYSAEDEDAVKARLEDLGYL